MPKTRAPHVSPELLETLRSAGYLVIDPDRPGVRARIARAIQDPARYVRRDSGGFMAEPRHVHKMRAVLVALGDGDNG